MDAYVMEEEDVVVVAAGVADGEVVDAVSELTRQLPLPLTVSMYGKGDFQ